MQRDKGYLDDNSALLAVVLVSLMFLTACGPSKELLLCRNLIGQCDQAMDICLSERKTAELRRAACEQTAGQLIKCLDGGKKK